MTVELLQGNQAGFNGAVRVTVNGLMGRVCANNWTDTAANAVCRQLGAAGGKAYQLTSQVCPNSIEIVTLRLKTFSHSLAIQLSFKFPSILPRIAKAEYGEKFAFWHSKKIKYKVIINSQMNLLFDVAARNVEICTIAKHSTSQDHQNEKFWLFVIHEGKSSWNTVNYYITI